jgi:hypothetical protein
VKKLRQIRLDGRAFFGAVKRARALASLAPEKLVHVRAQTLRNESVNMSPKAAADIRHRAGRACFRAAPAMKAAVFPFTVFKRLRRVREYYLYADERT